ncbi:MAG: H(+)-transporting ATPase [Ruminococcus sp.]|nr:H(+)-transporting ATPase [Ruminococcus sp.]
MPGIDEILNIIDSQQKQTEENLVSAAEHKASAIIYDGNEKAEKAFEEHIKKMSEQLAHDFDNACSSADAAMKRRILSRKTELIDETVEAAIEKLDKLPTDEYFAVLGRLAVKRLRAGEGVLSLSMRDLGRVPDSFIKELSAAAEKAGGSVKLGSAPADIENGFILTYGLISENCSFRAVVEAEREGVRDTAARVLFGQVV